MSNDQRLRAGAITVGGCSQSSILLVDDDPGSIQLLGRYLAGVADLRFATNGADAIRLAREAPPDLVLLDAEMPGMTGQDVCRILKADPRMADIPVVFITARRESDFEISAFDAGAVDFIVKPITPALVLARVKTQLRIKRLTDELRRLSSIDALTGVANRRCFDDVLQQEWRRARRAGEVLSVLMVDVDHFKMFNDHYGHPAGDACLRDVAQALAEACQRPGDMVARYGGEEFVLLLPQTPRQGAEQVARRVLEQLEHLAVPHAGLADSAKVTVSIGAACYDEESEFWMPCVSDSRLGNDMLPTIAASDLVRAADDGLYAAKRAGRARVVFQALSEPRVNPSKSLVANAR